MLVVLASDVVVYAWGVVLPLYRVFGRSGVFFKLVSLRFRLVSLRLSGVTV